jgi:hypothetical protein
MDGAKPLQIQTFIAQATIEAFPICILPQAAQRTGCCLDLLPLQPLVHGVRYKLRPIVTAQKGWCTILGDEARQYLNYRTRP